MLVNGYWFDGSASLLEAHRRVQAEAGPNTVWVPTYQPVPFPERGYLYRLLLALHRHQLCCFVTGTFTMYTAGLIHSYGAGAIFVALTHAPLLDLLFRRTTNPPAEFLLSGFKFVFVEAVEGYDICYFTVTYGKNFRIPITFFGVNTPVQCGPPSNMNLALFIWERLERLSFVKYGILLFPSNCRRPPMMFLKYYRAASDGWSNANECEACVERYLEALRPYHNCDLPDACRCNICVCQPPSLRDSASHILFRYVLDLERFELTQDTTYSQYRFAVMSGRVDELHLLPPRFPHIQIKFRHHWDSYEEERFHYHCRGELEYYAHLEKNFPNMQTAIDTLVSNECEYWCKHCERGLFFLPDCEHVS